jgi:uroporphyrinogen decarboxylase
VKKIRNDTLIRALRREPTAYTPIWLMRQAGRYLPEYNATRARAGDFLRLCQTPALATEVTLQPLERFPLDAAILFSDILTIPDAMGLGLYFVEGEGPRFQHPVRDEAAIGGLPVPDPDGPLRYVIDAVREIDRALAGRVPLIGFAGSPFTLACYMVEGGASEDFRTIKTMLYQRPELLHRLLDVNARAITSYLNAQIAAGVDAVMIFDTWGGTLAHTAYLEFSLAYIERIVRGLTRVPRIVFTKGAGPWLEAIAACGCDAVGVDWTVSLAQARQRIGARVALQGNLDPLALLTDPDTVRREASRVLADYGAGPGHVFNLGHGIVPATPPENVAALVEAVHLTSRQYHGASHSGDIGDGSQTTRR